MKRTLIVVAVAVSLVLATAAFAAQYGRPKPYVEPQDTGLTGYAEKTRSMSDCMTFSASHKSRGEAVDSAEFKRQFGDSTGGVGSATEYSYDKYTKIILDCSKKACSCKCLQK
jgi:hypothetical protein